MMFSKPHLHKTFAEGLIYKTEQGHCQLKRKRLGDLVVVSGHVAACDPLTDAEHSGFTRAIRPGVYPVIATIAHFAERDDERVAFAALQLRPQLPERWETAEYRPPKTGKESYGDPASFEVFSATGCFLDERAGALLVRKERDDADSGELGFGYVEKLQEALEANQVDLWSWANHVLDPRTGLNLILFTSGWGNGRYSTSWGLDAHDRPVCLVTDYQVL